MENRKFDWNSALALGSLWGLSEAAAGMFLRGTCARLITGSLMTGVAIFFMASALSLTKRTMSLFVLLFLATGFKLLDALFLHLPILHGAIGNPIFAFYTEVFALVILWSIFDARLREKASGHALLGGLTALVAVNLFPLVKFVTGIPACVYPGTKYPLSLYFAPLAIGISALSFPLGMIAGKSYARVSEQSLSQSPNHRFSPLLVRSVPLFSLVLIILIRLS